METGKFKIERKDWPESSNVESTRYFNDTKSLEVTMKSGGVYQYSNVPSEIWDELIGTNSIGGFLHSKIRGKYDSIKIR